jgi:hypothetical protein
MSGPCSSRQGAPAAGAEWRLVNEGWETVYCGNQMQQMLRWGKAQRSCAKVGFVGGTPNTNTTEMGTLVHREQAALRRVSRSASMASRVNCMSAR